MKVLFKKLEKLSGQAGIMLGNGWTYLILGSAKESLDHYRGHDKTNQVFAGGPRAGKDRCADPSSLRTLEGICGLARCTGQHKLGERDCVEDRGAHALIPLLGKRKEGAAWSARHENLQKELSGEPCREVR